MDSAGQQYGMRSAVQRELDTKELQADVVQMYSEHPWPLERDADEEMGWRLACLGVVPEDFEGKQVLDMGCGTGEYALWYANKGAGHVTAIDLSEGSLAIARDRKSQSRIDNIDFLKMDILECDLPDNTFDYSYSVGALHHTGDTYRGFRQLVRVTKPGGRIVLSLYNRYSNRPLRIKQWLLRRMGGKNLDRRVRLGRKLFAGTMRRMDRRYGGQNTQSLAYDILASPYSTFHTAREVLDWFDKNDVEYKGAFAPLRYRDYLYAFARPEYDSFRRTFDGFPGLRLASDSLARIARSLTRGDGEVRRAFPQPSSLEGWLVQNLWTIFGLRFNCFTISGTKLGVPRAIR